MSDLNAGLPLNEASLRAVALTVFDRVLGRTSSVAVFANLGDDAFSNPQTLIARLVSILDGAAGMLVQEMVDAFNGSSKATA